VGVAVTHIFPTRGGSLRVELGDQVTDKKALKHFEETFRGVTPESRAAACTPLNPVSQLNCIPGSGKTVAVVAKGVVKQLRTVHWLVTKHKRDIAFHFDFRGSADFEDK
jgi:hypothetical protein